MDVNEEVICDIVASSNDFINEVVKDYFNKKEVVTEEVKAILAR